MRALLLATALAAGCSSTGFALDVTVTADSCVAAATHGMAVLVTPAGGGTVTEVVESPFFDSTGTRRVVVVPRDGTTSLRVEVRAYSDSARKMEIERASQTFMVQGNQILDGTLELACPFEDMAVPIDSGVPDTAGPREGGAGDGAIDLRSGDAAARDMAAISKG
jgi:hypothetical protein